MKTLVHGGDEERKGVDDQERGKLTAVLDTAQLVQIEQVVYGKICEKVQQGCAVFEEEVIDGEGELASNRADLQEGFEGFKNEWEQRFVRRG